MSVTTSYIDDRQYSRWRAVPRPLRRDPRMSRVQLALRVADLEGSIDFYARLFNTTPAKRRPGYANFAITEPPLKLVLLEGEPGEATRMDHLGVEVPTSEEVAIA